MTFNEFMLMIEVVKEKNPHLFDLERDAVVDDSVVSVVEQKYGIIFPECYKNFVRNFGGGCFGYIIVYSLDSFGLYNILEHVSKDMICKMEMLPVIDLETGDYIGFDIIGGKCLDRLVYWEHDSEEKKIINAGFYEILINMGLYNASIAQDGYLIDH